MSSTHVPDRVLETSRERPETIVSETLAPRRRCNGSLRARPKFWATSSGS
jgi:hypothetical protein